MLYRLLTCLGLLLLVGFFFPYYQSTVSESKFTLGVPSSPWLIFFRKDTEDGGFSQGQKSQKSASEECRIPRFPDGTRIVSGSQDGTLKLWDAVTSRSMLTIQAHTAGDAKAPFLPDGNKWHTATVASVAFIPDGARFLSGSQDHTLKLRDASRAQSKTERALRAFGKKGD